MGSGERQASPSGAALRGLQVAPALLAPRWPDAESRGFPEGRGRRRCGAGVGEAWWRGAVTQHPFLHRVPKTPRATPALLLRQTGPPSPYTPLLQDPSADSPPVPPSEPPSCLTRASAHCTRPQHV